MCMHVHVVAFRGVCQRRYDKGHVISDLHCYNEAIMYVFIRLFNVTAVCLPLIINFQS